MDEKKLKTLVADLAKGLKTDAELTDHLGHESNTRNGYSTKTWLCDDGELEINTPRDRESSFSVN